jgi:hypothetical protein
MEPSNRLVVPVHKEGAEGAIEVDRDTGIILTKTDQRPDWAEGLAVALLAERHTFYTRRLGTAFTEDMKHPKSLAFQDLGWIGMDQEQNECELSADGEYRMDVVAKVLGINREDFETEAPFGQTVAEAEIDLEARHISKAEAGEIEAELLTGFIERHPEAAKKLAEG